MLHAEGGVELAMGDRVIFQVEQLKNPGQKARVAQKCKTTATICISAWPINDVCSCNEGQPVQYQLAAEVAFKPRGSAGSTTGVVVREGEPGFSFVAPRDGKLVPRDVPLEELKADIEKMKPQVCQKTTNSDCKGMIPDGDPSVTDHVGQKSFPFILPYVVCQAGRKKGSVTGSPCEEAGK